MEYLFHAFCVMGICSFVLLSMNLFVLALRLFIDENDDRTNRLEKDISVRYLCRA